MYKVGFVDGTEWQVAYQRNNKSKEQKNLRCFPCCCHLYGHQEGFCGRSVMVKVTVPTEKINEKVIAVAEFASEDKPMLQVGSMIPLSILNKHDLVEEKIEDKLFFDGLICQDANVLQNETVFEFNRNLKGWHYGYLGSKKTRDSYHTFRVYVVEPIEGNFFDKTGEQMYKILAGTESPKWQMYCRRRKHPNAVQKPAKMHLEQFVDNGDRFKQLQQQQKTNLLKTEIRSNTNMKRRPDSINIPGDNRLAVRRKSNPCPDILNLSISSGHSFELPTPRSVFSDNSNTQNDPRYDKLLDAIQFLKLETPIQVRNISISRKMVEPFADKVYEFLKFWNSTKGTIVRIPQRALQVNFPRATEIERFTGFILQKSEFQNSVNEFIKRDNPFGKQKDHMQLCVFALKEITSFFKPFVDQEKWQNEWQRQWSKNDHNLNNMVTLETESHGSAPVDLCLTPRSLNMEDFELMRNSLITPRSVSSPTFSLGSSTRKMDGNNMSHFNLPTLSSPPSFLSIPSPIASKKDHSNTMKKQTEISGIGGSFYLSNNLPSPLQSPGFMNDVDKLVSETNYLDPNNDSWIGSSNGNLKMSPSSRLVQQFF